MMYYGCIEELDVEYPFFSSELFPPHISQFPPPRTYRQLIDELADRRLEGQIMKQWESVSFLDTTPYVFRVYFDDNEANPRELYLGNVFNVCRFLDRSVVGGWCGSYGMLYIPPNTTYARRVWDFLDKLRKEGYHGITIVPHHFTGIGYIPFSP